MTTNHVVQLPIGRVFLTLCYQSLNTWGVGEEALNLIWVHHCLKHGLQRRRCPVFHFVELGAKEDQFDDSLH